jgi:hypothetical protein
MLSSSGGLRTSRLSSLKSLRVNSSSRVVSGKISSSIEERSTTGIVLEGSPCSQTGEGGLRGESSDGDTASGTESDGDGGGVEAQHEDDEEPSLEGEQESLVLTCLPSWLREGERKTIRGKSKGMRDGYQRKIKEIFTVVKHRGATVMGVVSILMHPLAHVTLKIMHHVPVIQANKQIVQLFRERYTET